MLEFTGNYSFTTGTEVCIKNFISFHRLRVFRPNPTLQKMINNLFNFFGTVGMYRYLSYISLFNLPIQC